MTNEEKKMLRPALKEPLAPLRDEEAFFRLPLPGVSKDDDALLPSQADTWLSDENAVAFMNAFKKGEDVSGWDLHGLNLKGANLKGGSLKGVNLSHANLTGANLSGADLTGADLSFAYLEAADLSGADLTDADVHGAFVRQTNLTDAVMDEKDRKYLEFAGWLVEEIENGRIDIRNIPKEELRFLDIRLLDLSKVNFNEMDLDAFVLQGVNLTGVRIDKKQMMSLAQLLYSNKYIAKLRKKEALQRARFVARCEAAYQERIREWGLNDSLMDKMEADALKQARATGLTRPMMKNGAEYEAYLTEEEEELLKKSNKEGEKASDVSSVAAAEESKNASGGQAEMVLPKGYAFSAVQAKAVSDESTERKEGIFEEGASLVNTGQEEFSAVPAPDGKMDWSAREALEKSALLSQEESVSADARFLDEPALELQGAKEEISLSERDGTESAEAYVVLKKGKPSVPKKKTNNRD